MLRPVAIPRTRADRRRRARRIGLLRLATLVGVLSATTAAVTVALADGGRGAQGRAVGVESVTGLPVTGLHLIGVAGEEAWGYGKLGSVPAQVDGRRVPPAGSASGAQVLVRYLPSTGWRVAGLPKFADPDPSRRLKPLEALGDASMDPSGAGAILAKSGIQADDSRDESTLFVRSPGGDFVEAAPIEQATTPTPEPEPTPTPDPATTPTPTSSARPTDKAPASKAARSAVAESASATPSSTTSDAATPGGTTPSSTTPDATSPSGTTPDSTTPADTTTPVAPTPAAPASAPTTPDSTSLPATGRAVTGAATSPGATSPGATSPDATTPETVKAGVEPAVLQPYEHLWASRRLVLAVKEPSGAGGALVGVVSNAPATSDDPGSEASVFHYDGTRWAREPIEIPAEQDAFGAFRIAAIAGTGLGDAWLLGTPAPGGARGLSLFHRGDDGVWRDVSLGDSPFAQASGPGYSAVTPLTRTAQSLTVTSDGVWIDGSLVDDQGATRDFTIYYDRSRQSITGSFCALSICDQPLGAGFDIDLGYRSFAWPGGGPHGQRVITNPWRGTGLKGSGDGARLVLRGTAFDRVPGLANEGPDGALSAPDAGWLVGAADWWVTHLGPDAASSTPQQWPVPIRSPLLAVSAEPGRSPSDPQAQALAVGLDGAVARYLPGQGWDPEYLQDGNGLRQKPDLRAVAWPEGNRAHAVGGNGQMWLWRAATGLWEPDPGKPLDFDGNLMSIAFRPGAPEDGYAVGRSGTLLRYGKTWAQQDLPDGLSGMDFTSVTFAGTQAVVVWRSPDGTRGGLLVRNQDGSGWHSDDSAAAALDPGTGPDDVVATALPFAVSGLPDGGAIAAGNGIVIERDGLGQPWRRSASPLPGLSLVAVAAVRDGATVTAVVAGGHVAGVGYPLPDVRPPVVPGESPQLYDAIPPPMDAVLLREASGGWVDDSHQTDVSIGGQQDGPSVPDQAYAFALDASGRGWAVGGKTLVGADAGLSAQVSQQRTAAIFRYPSDAATAPPQTSTSAVPLPAGPVRLAFGGQATCSATCSDEANLGIAADIGLSSAINDASALAGRPGAPRSFFVTGPRLASAKLTPEEAQRYATVATSSPGLPVYTVPGPDSADVGTDPFAAAFAAAPAPQGAGALPSSVQLPGSVGGVAPGPGEARKHYAFDSTGPEGTVRVIVIDNGSGSLAGADAFSRPRDTSQEAWLVAALASAKADGVPSIAVGDRDLNTDSKATNVASDAAYEALLLLQGGASAYFFDSPGENRQALIPAGGAQTLPQFGTGTLGKAMVTQPPLEAPYYGEAGYLLAEIDVSKRDPASNVAPVTVRLIPVIDQLAVDAQDGTLLRRSQTAVFAALGRRPLMGDVDPYVQMPTSSCRLVSCPGRIGPEFQFTSSNPDIADFVQRSPQSSDPHAIALGSDGRPIADGTSGVICAFNAGTTTLTASAGGRSFSQVVTVQAGAVARPCGTRPLVNPPARQATAVVPPPPPPAPAPAPNAAPPSASPPVPPVPAPPAAPVPPAPAPPAAPVLFLAAPAPVLMVPLSPLPPPPPVGRPLPPVSGGGVGVNITQPVSQFEEKREEEEAFESSSAYAVAQPQGQGRVVGGGLLLLVLAGVAGAGASVRRRPHRGPRLATISATTPPIDRERIRSRDPKPLRRYR